MASVADALTDLGITEWVLRGEPTTEAEFNSMFRKITGTDASGSGIESDDTDDFGVTWSQITAANGTRQCSTHEGIASSA